MRSTLTGTDPGVDVRICSEQQGERVLVDAAQNGTDSSKPTFSVAASLLLLKHNFISWRFVNQREMEENTHQARAHFLCQVPAVNHVGVASTCKQTRK